MKKRIRVKGVQKEIEMFAEIKKELKRLFGDDLIVSKLPLFKTKVIKGTNVNYKYLYYALNGHKPWIKIISVPMGGMNKK